MNTMPQMRGLKTQKPRERRFTVWHNPTDHEMSVIVHEHTVSHEGCVLNHPVPTRLTFPPHADTELSSEFDSAIHLVQCDQDACRQRGTGYCREPNAHRGHVVGGGAPLLRRKGGRAELLDILDPVKAAKAALLEASTKKGQASQMLENQRIVDDARRTELEAEERKAAETEAAYQAKLAADEAAELARMEAATRPEPKADGKPTKR